MQLFCNMKDKSFLKQQKPKMGNENRYLKFENSMQVGLKAHLAAAFCPVAPNLVRKRNK